MTPGQRTVTAALRVMGLNDDRNYARYHHVLNRAVWSPLQVSQVLLGLLLQHLDRSDGPLVFGIDETLERRQGPRISALGIYRYAVRSSRSQVVKASGLRWISLMWLGHIPWAHRGYVPSTGVIGVILVYVVQSAAARMLAAGRARCRGY